MIPGIWEDVGSMWEKLTTSKKSAEVAVAKSQSINPQEEQYQDEDDIDKVNLNSMNINSIPFHSTCSVITANLSTSSSQAASVVPYTVDSGDSGNILPFHIFKKLFPRSTKEQPAAIENENIKLGTYNSTTITQLGRCKVRIENNNKIKTCSFFVVPRNRQPLFSIPDN